MAQFFTESKITKKNIVSIMEENFISGILLIVSVIVLIIRNWLHVNSERVLKGQDKIGVLKSYLETIFTIKPFLIVPILKKPKNRKVQLMYFYINILTIIFYSLILNIIFNII